MLKADTQIQLESTLSPPSNKLQNIVFLKAYKVPNTLWAFPLTYLLLIASISAAYDGI